MSAENTDFLMCQAMQAVLEDLDPEPDVVQIMPAGAELQIPNGGECYWITLSVQDNDITQETSNSYIALSTINVMVGVRNKKQKMCVAERITAAATNVFATLSTSVLGGYARRAPVLTPDGYSGGEGTDVVFWYSLTGDWEHQVNS